MAAGKQRGYTLIAVLVVLAIMMLGLSTAGPLWSQQSKRDREKELLKIGMLYAQAIERYRQDSPGSDKRYPRSLVELLADNRFVGTKRYLRRLYPDPIANNPAQAWGLLRNGDGQITGVFSQSTDVPIAQSPLTLADAQFGEIVLPPAKQYSDWKFSFATATALP